MIWLRFSYMLFFYDLASFIYISMFSFISMSNVQTNMEISLFSAFWS